MRELISLSKISKESPNIDTFKIRIDHIFSNKAKVMCISRQTKIEQKIQQILEETKKIKMIKKKKKKQHGYSSTLNIVSNHIQMLESHFQLRKTNKCIF